MKKFSYLILLIGILSSCDHDKKTIVETVYIDSLIKNFTEPAVATNQADVEFWGNRIDPLHPGLTNELKYASMLAARFGLKGDINDLLKADSTLYGIIRTYNDHEPSPYTSLIPKSISQHKFSRADTFLIKAKQLGIKKYDASAYSFDVNFELGRYLLANENLKSIKDNGDYGYEFRRSKMEHYKGNLDSATAAMLAAASVAGDNPLLISAALSNAADLEIHSGKLEDAYNLYKRSIAANSSDLHSILGIGWIALVHDKNDSLAEKIFAFVATKTKALDAVLKLSQAYQLRNDSAAQKKYAQQFVDSATNPLYGTMYNKYLVELYTGILHEPAKAEVIAKYEIDNRATPQTYAWYVWSLFYNNKKNEAYKVYEANVSGKPLEGIELFWMGKMMKGLDKGYNAHEFFKAAEKNKYDLDPSMAKDLQENLKE